MNKTQYQFGVTESFPCAYLNDQKERLLVAVDDALKDVAHYETLMQLGFRRSKDHIYRPHCERCQACQSIRIPVTRFKPSRSQKRLLKKNQNLMVNFIQAPLSDMKWQQYYQMFSRYIEQRHTDGTMYPPDVEQFNSLLQTDWMLTGFLEVYQNEKLVAVAIVDCMSDSISAVYTFFEPDAAHLSLGTFAILELIRLANVRRLSYLYLGYQVDECRKMNYKTRFLPHQRLIQNHWWDVEKTT
ncbi:arginyltransferase [Gayadomonas joobiniege]|uniref:arginyltransferase n=1 Tax=Gayadomonas joobiniege TaxID=1234606 RepID=UPI00036C9785|nr:arginyltransferase [Gayadomonas joobiniege]